VSGIAGMIFLTVSKTLAMSDNKQTQDQRDRTRVSGSDSYELSYLEEKLGKSRQEVRAAIEAVGSDRQKVEEYLKKNQ
jgi:Spy/CpxP family protein refolding chaperone